MHYVQILFLGTVAAAALLWAIIMFIITAGKK